MIMRIRMNQKSFFFLFVNFLTFSRFLVIPLMGYLHSHGPLNTLMTEESISTLLFVLVSYSGLSDFFDGYLSRSFQVTSKWGAVADHIADKLFVCLSFLFLQVFSQFPHTSFSDLMLEKTYFDLYFLLLLFTFSREIICSGLKEAFNQVPFKTSKLSKIKTSAQFVSLVFFYSSSGAWFGFLFFFLSVLLGYLSLGIYIQQVFTWLKRKSL